MADPTLFDLDAPTWAPVFHPPVPHAKDEWKAWQKSLRCRDCGSLMSKVVSSRSCGGAEGGGSYEVCDDCAAVDHCRDWAHDPKVCRRQRDNFTVEQVAECSCGWYILDRPWDGGVSAEEVLDTIASHVQYVHASRWGFTHTMAEHDRLTSLQARRRAKYLREVAA